MASTWNSDLNVMHQTHLRRHLDDGGRFERDIFDEEDAIKTNRKLKRQPSKKRKLSQLEDADLIKAKKLRRVLASEEGNPVSQLYQLTPHLGVAVVFSSADSVGPSHQPSFTLSAHIGDETFMGTGPTKKLAKENAARLAVEAIRAKYGVEKEVVDPTADVPKELLPSELPGPPGDLPKTLGSDDPIALPPNSFNGSSVVSAELPLNVEDVGHQAAQDAPDNVSSTLIQTVSESSAVALKSRKSLIPSIAADDSKISNAFRTPPGETSAETLTQLQTAFSNLSLADRMKLHRLMAEAFCSTDPSALAMRIGSLLKIATQVNEEIPADELPRCLNWTPRHHGCCFSFGQEMFFAVSHQKKMAKHAVGAQFLNWFLDVVPVIWRGLRIPLHLQTSLADSEGLSTDAVRAQTFASEVCSVVYSQLNTMTGKYAGSSFVRHLDHNSLAGICLSRDGVVTPIVLATGATVIYRKNLSSCGRNLKDCQAEVLALRGLKRFLLGQVSALFEKNDSIFEDTPVDGKLRLKGDVGFHLFLTRKPSGSCSMDPTNTADTEKPQSSEISSDSHGKFCCISSEVISAASCQSVDGVVENHFNSIIKGHDKLNVMSSSDKLLRKLVVGVQGSLVSIFTHPIFLQTICLRGTAHLASMGAGLFQRLLPVIPGDSAQLDAFPMVCPEICGTVEMADLDEKSLKTSPTGFKASLWIKGSGTLREVEEFLDTSSGSTVSGKTSEVCKRNLGLLCCSVAKAASSWEREKELDVTMQHVVSYADIKGVPVAYRAKCEYFRDVAKCLGSWIGKCPEEEEFAVVDAGNDVRND
ncbi:putative Double-stranded RNA-specific adenosine deaminase [Hypsibius exemplaris]|uniref:Double-stranded RNA-specific adenosine deaminase n=1 Tax=Hypsibius exemplaris TaxID=2072580 RepID=A0A1W0WSB6_HYPEX|nr:putative Double-stranded RNA-specific adenosine deaminase [Hypsibius exemplaris]